MRSIDCQHPSPFALHHLPPPPPPLPPSLPPIRAAPSPCLVRALTFSLFLSLLFVVLYCAAICSPLLLPHGDVSLFSFSPARARFVVALFLPPSVFAPYAPLAAARRSLGSSLGYGTIICLYGENGCFRAIPRKTILAICNLSRMRDM